MSSIFISYDTVINNRWRTKEKLGEGGFGAVYMVQKMEEQLTAAMKAEEITSEDHRLKMESKILMKMSGKSGFGQIYEYGKTPEFTYLIMTMFGPSLSALFDQCGKRFTVGTYTKVGIDALYAVKQLHDMGYVHRDIKAENFAIGKEGVGQRIVHLLDFGLCRKYVEKIEGVIKLKGPRKIAPFRGTEQYCSAHAHHGEQGPMDDLWSLIYMIVEFASGTLPWKENKTAEKFSLLKQTKPDYELFGKLPLKMVEIPKYLSNLLPNERPQYEYVYKVFKSVLDDYNVDSSAQFDWELLPRYRQEIKTGEIRPTYYESDFSSHKLGV